MAVDENGNEIDTGDTEQINRTKQRIDGLISDKTQAEKQAADALAAKEAAEKEAGFYKGFAELSGKYPAASEHLEDIKAKVLAGYTPEDATVAVLNSAGKLVPPPPPPPPPPPNAAGGSAPITIPDGGTKPISQWTQAERRAKLVELEQKGDIGLT